MNTLLLTDFFETEYPSYGSYDNIRKLGSYIDGFKASQRKAIYTILKKYPNINTEIKTARLASAIAEFTEYVHGEQSLTTVLETLTADFTGANNFPLIKGHGNFGSRFAGFGSAAAPRYTFISASPILKMLFNDDDLALCPSQIFEGSEIEPAFFVPTYPIILLNGIEGISSGWKTTIYPRNPKDVIQYMSDKINGKKCKDPNKFIPFFKNFKGYTKLENDVFINYGLIEQISSARLHITEIPIGFDHASYIKVLDKLIENQTINEYDDLSDPKTDSFEFIISVKKTFFDKHKTESAWVDVFRLSKTLNEQLNCIDKNNKVIEYNNIQEILDDFIKIRLEYYQKRKEYLINKFTNELLLNVSRLIWCTGIVNDTIKIRNIPRDKIITQLEKTDKIIKKDNSYNYLLNMPLTSITKEKIDELKNLVKELKNKITFIESQTKEDFMNIDLNNLPDIFK